jgi:adenylate kinase
MRTISEGMGSGLIQRVELSDVVEEEWSEFLSIDLKIRPSSLIREQLTWHCRKGICKQTMEMLNQEFNLFRGLFPLKLLITGPPASGKTHFALKLA